MTNASAGKWLLSFLAVFTAVSPYLADWNETHIYNPTWPPHAKFHNAQTMVFGALLGLLALLVLWARRGTDERQRLNEAAVLTGLYWVAQLPAILFPGTALRDPGGLVMPRVLGLEFNQLTMDLLLILPLLALGYYLERRRLDRAARSAARSR